MLNGIASILMSSGPPPDTPVDEGDKEKLPKHGLAEGPADGLADRISLVHRGHPGTPVIAAAFAIRDGISEMLNSSTNSNSFKRQADMNDESSVPSKRNKIEGSGSDVVFRGWGPNGNAVNVSDAGLLSANQNFIGSLLSSQMTQNSFLTNSTAPSAATFPDATSLSLRNDGYSSILYRDQMSRDQTINAMLLAKLVASNEQLGSMGASVPILNSSQNLLQLQQRLRPLGNWGNSFQQPGMLTASPLELQQSQLNQRLYGNVGSSLATSGYRSFVNESEQGNSSQEQLSNLPRGFSTFLNGSDQGNSSAEQLHALFRQIQDSTFGNQQPIMNTPAHGSINFALNMTNHESALFPVPQEQQQAPMQPLLAQRSILDLPPCDEGKIESHSTRPSFPLGIPEDPNWLSEFHCFVRSHLVEVFRAGYDDVKIRNNSIIYQQVGIRCRFCANMPHGVRSGRASAFPSSLRQIYQSFTMMLRDHFVSCEAIPASTLEEFTALKNKPAQGATDSKRYWIYSAKKIGMIDSSDGIVINQKSRAEGIELISFGTVPGQTWEDEAFRGVSLVRPGDRELVAEFLLVLLSQVQPIRLTEAECIGNRRSLRVGLPGFGCRFCCEHKRLGLCRMFPARRRTLPNKVNDLYDHLRRCTLCPQPIKDSLEDAKHRLTSSFQSDQAGDREFFDRVWSRLGHTAGSDST